MLFKTKCVLCWNNKFFVFNLDILRICEFDFQINMKMGDVAKAVCDRESGFILKNMTPETLSFHSNVIIITKQVDDVFYEIEFDEKQFESECVFFKKISMS